MKYTLQIFLFFIFFISYAEENPSSLEIDDFSFTEAEKVDTYTSRIPFKLVDRLILIEGKHQDQKGMFILDTGAERLILNKVHFSSFENQNSKRANTSGIIDNVEGVIEKRIQKVKFNNLSIENKRSHIIDMSHIEKSKKVKILGIIGYNVLKDYEIFIDMYLNQITLTKIDKEGNKLGELKYLEKITDSLNFKLKHHTIVIKGTVNNKKLTFGLDTGAEFNQISNKVSKEILRSFYPKKRIKLMGASDKKIEVLYGNLHKVKLTETVYFGPMKTILTNLNSMNEAFGTKLDGILGHDFFAQKRAIINYKKEKIYFIDFPTIR